MNNPINNINLIDGLNINPISLEFSNEMTTTKMLAGMQAKVNTLVNFINEWYGDILNDIEEGGQLYEALSTSILKEVNTDFTTLNNTINNLQNLINSANDEITTLSYKKSSITIDVLPTQRLYNIGENINSVVINYNIIKGSNDITEIKLYKNGELLKTVTTNIELSGNIVDASIINSDVSYHIEINDGKNIVISNVIEINFINNFFIGSINDIDNINADIINLLTPIKINKGNYISNFNCNNSYPCIVYPADYGDLLEILDNDEYNIIDIFNKTEITLNAAQYICYYFTNPILDPNFDLQFIFNIDEIILNVENVVVNVENINERIEQNENSISIISSQLTEKANQADVNKDYRYKDYNYDFSSKENLIFKNVDGTDANSWILNSDMTITPVVTTNEPICWIKEKIQDGSISLIWENPTLAVGSNNTYTGIIFRGKDYKNGLIAVVFGGVAVPQVVKLFKFTNGDRAFTELVSATMTTDDVKLKEGIPSMFQVEFDGKYVTISVNGKKMINKYTDSNITGYNNGYIGIITGRDAGNLTSKFSNLSIKEKCYDKMPTEGISSILGAGDSIMYGVGASDVNTKSWMKLLESKIKEFNPSLVVKNVGVGGQNTTEVLNNQIIPEMANKYDVVIIQCGTNNGRLEIAKKTTYDIAIQDLCTMIKLIKSTGAIPIVCTTTPYAYNISSIPSSYDNTSYWYNVKLNGLIRQLCAKEKIRIIDNYSIFNNNLTLLGSDQLHPNDTGQVLMKDNAYNVLFGNFIS